MGPVASWRSEELLKLLDQLHVSIRELDRAVGKEADLSSLISAEVGHRATVGRDVLPLPSG